jgi:signal transduction histidine kinase/ActR/RegA family two-component response regulator
LPPSSEQDRGRAPPESDLVRTLAEASQDCIWVLRPDGRVAYMSPRSERLLETSAPTGTTHDLRDLWPQESRFSLDRALAAAAAGQVFRFRTFFHAPARAYWETVISPMRDAQAVVVSLLAVARDVTTEVETHAFLETVIQLLPSPLTVKNAGDRRFVLINRAAEDLLGVTADDAIGRTAREVFGDGASIFQKAEDEVLGTGELRRLDYHAPGGESASPRYISVKLMATQDDLGPRHLITLGDDVTERRAAAESLRAALEAAKAASEAKSAFLANMSHELRTPLNGIVAGADMLARGDLSARSRELVDMIRTSSETLERLLSDVLDLARAESGQVALESQPFHVGETLRAVAGLFRPAAHQKGLHLTIELTPDLDGMALGDMARLRQVLSNLLNNAVKFTERGAIVLRGERTADGVARFRVTDTGIGFDPAAKHRIFGRFQQADESFTRRFGGAGLGLSISRELVELMGGTLDCDSRLGGGSQFWFEIPLPADASALDGVAEPGPAAQPDLGLRILLADDHPTNRQVVQLMLGGVADIVAVENGAEAVDAFRRQAFDLVLMDMQMPVMDGLDAVREVRALERARGGRATPIIMVTANARPEHMAASREAGADQHLGKPVTTQSLFAAIEEALAEPEADDHHLYANFGHRGP